MYAFIKKAWGPAVVDGRLNPSRLALASWCYWIQSNIFRIPDRFGYIAPGPPRLRVQEAESLLAVVFGSIVLLYITIPLFLFRIMTDEPGYAKVHVALSCIGIMLMVGICWTDSCFDPRRAPGYVWEDWKVRRE